MIKPQVQDVTANSFEVPLIFHWCIQKANGILIRGQQEALRL